MPKTVFISYSHHQGEWVWQRLKPCLQAGGAEVRIDVERFRAGKDVTAQMDAEQDASDFSLLVLSPEYLASTMCQHEMQRAIACNKFVGVVRAACTVPDEIKKTLYVDLRDDKAADKWDLLMRECDADLGAAAPNWLHARDEIVRYMQRGNSVNLVVPRKPGFSKPKWRELIAHLQRDFLLNLAVINLESGDTSTRQGLVQAMLKASGSTLPAPAEPQDLVTLAQAFAQNPAATSIALIHFDIVAGRTQRNPHYNVDLFAAWRDLITEKRKLILLIHSRTHFMQLLPNNHPLSSITDLKTVELHGRP